MIGWIRSNWLGRRGRVLGVKLGYNPNSSSLGADVTFLILGAAGISILAPFMGALVRLALGRRQRPEDPERADADSLRGSEWGVRGGRRPTP